MVRGDADNVEVGKPGIFVSCFPLLFSFEKVSMLFCGVVLVVADAPNVNVRKRKLMFLAVYFGSCNKLFPGSKVLPGPFQ